LHKKSGITKISFLNRISSASGVVGPLASSAIILQLRFCAFLCVITFSRAAGIKISHSNSNNSLFDIS